jgi:hypothetical protein
VPYGTGYLFTATFSGFSKFFLIDDNVLLPVTLVSFAGRLENNTIPLSWITASEQNAAYFEVERSANGIDFYTIGRVAAAGTSFSPRNYQFTDRQINDLNYYRLKMTDADGGYSRSDIILIRNPGILQKLQVTNPFTNELRLRFARLPQQKIIILLETVNGQKLLAKEFPPSATLNLELSALRLSKGVYLLTTIADGQRWVNRLVK